MLLSLVQDKQRKVCRQIYGVREKYIVELSLVAEEILGSSWSLRNLNDNPKRIEALHGASLPREFERQDMAKIFNKKIKTRFPILFKRALDFHLMKARGRV